MILLAQSHRNIQLHTSCLRAPPDLRNEREQLRTVHDATRFDRPLCLYCIPPAPSWSTPRLPLGTHNQLHAAAILNIVSCRPLRARLDLLGLAGIVLHTTPDSETLDAAVVRLEFTVIV
ncbi:hypothetical protein PG990_005550 [Apiospora arundinis]